MRTVLVVISDEALMSRVRLCLSDPTIKYYFTAGADEAIRVTEDNEIAIAVMDFRLPVMNGQDMCEIILEKNPKTQNIFIFNEEDTERVLSVYNEYHISKLLCKENMILDDLPNLIEDSLHIYNRVEEINTKSKSVNRLNDKYLKPLHEMSEILNERMDGYQEIIRIYNDCLKFITCKTERALKALNIYVDRIVNDYIQLYMIRRPEYDMYFGKLSETFNKPDQKKYFKFIDKINGISDLVTTDVFYAIDILTILFDSFFVAYRGKIELAEVDGMCIVNAIYEVRDDEENSISYMAINIVKGIINAQGSKLQFAKKDNMIQYKAFFNNDSKEIITNEKA